MKKYLVLLLLFLFFFTACQKNLPAHAEKDFTNANIAQQNQQDGALSYRAMWFSYLEWSGLDTTTKESFTNSVAHVMEQCENLGLNRIIVQVRPFGDAIYPSKYFPWSHLITGEQGKDPGYDPLAIFVEQAHLHNLAIEAWVNPYRIQLSASNPKKLSDNNLAIQHPEWVKQAAGGLYLEPSNPEVQQYLANGVAEILQNYDVDGIQFDDYFYPTTDSSFDAVEYQQMGNGQSLADWRRQNVNTFIQKIYQTVKNVSKERGRPFVFGISPQGNNDNNFNGQYSDVALWLSQEGYVDYIMPQVYWGYDFTLKNGSKRFAFENIIQEWLLMPRHENVQLYFGLGAYRVGEGDESSTASQEWKSGNNLAKMVQTMFEKNVPGYALYRYDSLFRAGQMQPFAQSEISALTQYHQQQGLIKE